MKPFLPSQLALLLSLAGCASTPAGKPVDPVAAAAAAKPAKPARATADPHLFDGCTASPNAGVGWSYACDGFAASTADFIGAKTEDLLAATGNGIRDAMQGKVDGKLAEADQTYDLAGKPRTGRLTTFKVSDKVVLRADAAIVPVEGSGTRLVSCGGSPSEQMETRCHALLDFLARDGWREDAVAGVPVVSDEIALVGHVIDVPKNCHASKVDDKDAKGATIWCDGELSLIWLEGPTAQKLSRESFLANGGGRHRTAPCSLDSVATSCDVLSDGSGDAYRASAKVRANDVTAVCLAPAANVPAICDRVLAIARGK